VDEDRARLATGIVPLAIVEAGRHEGERFQNFSQCGARQSLDDRLSSIALPLIIDHQQVGFCTGTNFKSLAASHLNDLGAHSVPVRCQTLDYTAWRNLNTHPSERTGAEDITSPGQCIVRVRLPNGQRVGIGINCAMPIVLNHIFGEHGCTYPREPLVSGATTSLGE
jgi:hypothetical protein